MKITWNTNVNAPGYLGQIVAEDSRTILIMTCLDYCDTASSFGWSIRDVQNDEYSRCDHSCTDGTADCPDCGLSAATFIEAARQWLADNGGTTVDDPGYFE